MKFDDDKLKEVVPLASSYSDVFKRLGVAKAGTTAFTHLKTAINKLGLSTDHFKGLGKNGSVLPTVEEIKKAVAECTSLAQVVERFGKNPNSTGSRAPFEKIIDDNEMDRSHWKGQGIHAGGQFRKNI